MTDLVSAIVPVYGVEAFLDDCVAGLLAQSHTEMEVVLIDDGSPDRCPALCDDWASRDPRVVVVHQANAGLATARNAGVDVARGKFVTFVDADDVVAADYVKRLLALASATGADIATSGLVAFSDGLPEFARSSTSTVGPAQSALASIVTAGNGFEACGKLYRTHLFSSIRFTPGIRFEDLEILPRLFGAAQTVVRSEDALYGYRRRSGSIMHGARKVVGGDLLDVLQSNIDLAAETHGRETDAFEGLLAGYVLHGSATLERAGLERAVLAPDYAKAYRSFLATNSRDIASSAAISRTYKLGLLLSWASPLVFVRAVGFARRVKAARLLPVRRRRGKPSRL